MKTKKDVKKVNGKEGKEKELIPTIGDFSQFFKKSEKFADNIADVIADVYAWSSALEPADDSLPLPFVSKNEEVVWSYLKHQNKQLDGVNRKFKGFLSELVGKPLIRLPVQEDSDADSFEMENEEEEELEDEFVDEEDSENSENSENEEEEEETDIFNLKESDLKSLDADLKRMEQDSDSEELDVDGSTKMLAEQPKKFKKSIVDDEFFSLEEMHDFLKKTERNGGKQQQEETGLFEDEDSWDGKTDYTYEDFFGARGAPETPKKKRKAVENEEESLQQSNKKRVRFAMDEQENEPEEPKEELEDEDELSEQPVLLGANLEEPKEQSAFEKRQSKMKERIAKLEEENLAPKSWELTGEVAAEQREQNTLLEKHVDYDHGAKRAPEITEEFTDKLEQLIKQRIRDKTWDDVIRVKKVEQKGAFFEAHAIENVFNEKKSLAEVYEKEYQDQGSVEQSEKKNEAHEQIKSKMSQLFGLIDALTHFEYKPEQAREELKVVSNMAALRVEEVGIMASSEALLMAPEEVSKKMRALEKSKEERTETDKNRERRKKKSKQRALLEKFGEEKVFGAQKAKKAEKKSSKSDKDGAEKVKSSNFFAKLQETVSAEKKSATTKKKRIVRVKSEKNSAAIKL